MLPPTTIPATFPRSTRAIHADSLYPGLAILIVLIVVLTGGLLWMVLFQIPFYEISQSAQVTPDALIVADFPADALSLIEPGQTALFIPGDDTGGPIGAGTSVRVTVADVDIAHGQVQLLVPDEPNVRQLLYPGLSGQVYVVVRKESPFALIIAASGMGTS